MLLLTYRAPTALQAVNSLARHWQNTTSAACVLCLLTVLYFCVRRQKAPKRHDADSDDEEQDGAGAGPPGEGVENKTNAPAAALAGSGEPPPSHITAKEIANGSRRRILRL